MLRSHLRTKSEFEGLQIQWHRQLLACMVSDLEYFYFSKEILKF